MDLDLALELSPEPDESTRRALAIALARLPAAGRTADPYASPWRAAGVVEAGESGRVNDDGDALGAYGCSPRSIRGVTRA